MADTPTIEEIRKRHANYPWPEDQSWQDIDFLLAKVDCLNERWNTRFDVLCGLCGHRYRGPRDEDKHGYGKCD